MFIDQDTLIADYIDGMSIADICTKHKCSPASVSRIARKYGILRRDNFTSRGENFNHNYFDVIDTVEKAHWLKFFAEHGSISPAKNLISVRAERSEVEGFRKAIGAETKKVYANVESDVNEVSVVQFQVSSKHMVEILREAKDTKTGLDNEVQVMVY